MKTKILCFASSKGGSGKTVTAASLAYLLSNFDKKVLIIDADASTNGLTLLFLEELIEFKNEIENEKLYGIFECEIDGHPTPFPLGNNLDLIPATYTLKQTENCSLDDFENSLSQTVIEFREKYDFIILDAQAGSDQFARIAVKKANSTIIVSEFDPISAEGIERLKKIFSDELSYENTWILLNKVLPEFSKSLKNYLGIFKFLSPIPWDAEVIRSFATRKLGINFDNINDYTLAIVKVAQSLLGKEIENDIEKWLSSKETLFREPARMQLDEAESKIVEVEKAIINTEYEIQDIQKKSNRLSTLFGSVIVSIIIGMVGSLVAASGLEFFKRNLYYLVSLAVMLPILIVMTKMTIDRLMNVQYKEKKKNLEEMNLVYKRKLEELLAHKSKISTILESDLEDLLSKKEKNKLTITCTGFAGAGDCGSNKVWCQCTIGSVIIPCFL